MTYVINSEKINKSIQKRRNRTKYKRIYKKEYDMNIYEGYLVLCTVLITVVGIVGCND